MFNTTLLLPCAGNSTRFPDMKPKWMLTHPSGKIMLLAGLESMNLTDFDRVVVTITEHQVRAFDAKNILLQAFNGYPNVNICVLENPTTGPAETIYETLIQEKIEGSFCSKDCDNYFTLEDFPNAYVGNFVLGIDLDKISISKPSSKSYCIVNEQGLLLDIVEKSVVSQRVCLGFYGFSESQNFLRAYQSLLSKVKSAEIFVSHIISDLLATGSDIFEYFEASSFEDWGTVDEWRSLQDSRKSLFLDFDGVLVRNSGMYGEVNWDSEFRPLIGNLECVRKLADKGSTIVITTSRPAKFKEKIISFLSDYGIPVSHVVTDLPHAPRILVNDFAPTNPFPSALGLSIPRDGSLGEYLN